MPSHRTSSAASRRPVPARRSKPVPNRSPRCAPAVHVENIARLEIAVDDTDRMPHREDALPASRVSSVAGGQPVCDPARGEGAVSSFQFLAKRPRLFPIRKRSANRRYAAAPVVAPPKPQLAQLRRIRAETSGEVPRPEISRPGLRSITMKGVPSIRHSAKPTEPQAPAFRPFSTPGARRLSIDISVAAPCDSNGSQL